MNDHDHDHPHAEISDTERPGYFDMLETALEELLIERRLIASGEIRSQIDVLNSRTPALGAKVIARAWTESGISGALAGGRSGRLRRTRHHLLRRYRSCRPREHGQRPQSGRLHALLLLPAPCPRLASRLVQAEALSGAGGRRAARAARRVWHGYSGRCGNPRNGLDVGASLSCPSTPSGRNGGLHRGRAGRTRDARRDDRGYSRER